MKPTFNRNTIKTLTFMSTLRKPHSVAEMINQGLSVPRASLYTTMDMLLEGHGANPLITLVSSHDGRTSFRYEVTEAGRQLAIHMRE